ncbi:MAG: MBL fold metallo-hydrolase [Alphaproteobacteria bacterium]|nr:MBL fold metallo-hydrolase [Alphaproteobacteria bacterium]
MIVWSDQAESSTMRSAPYVKGLVDLGRDAFAYLQPDGGWGWSNAGFIRDGDRSLLVDTLFDEPLTAQMLARIEGATGIAADRIGTIVNTHANGDHTHGNALVGHAEIIASEASAHEMAEFSPQLLAQLKAAGAAGQMGLAGEYFAEVFAPFDFANARGKAPTRTFRERLEIRVGDKQVVLTDVGPAHTRGDVIVHSVADRVVFTGDILFIEGTPIMWAGPVENWIRACDLILSLDVDAIVPGHGPLADVAAVRRVQDYLRYIEREARARFDAGLSAEEAAFDIALGDYDSWGDAERIAVNVDTLYRGWRHDHAAANAVELFGLMGKLARERAARKRS